MANWTWPSSDRKLRHSAPTEHWRATDRHGILVGEAWLTVDNECALLHAMACSQTDVRWLLHTEIVERLCASSCRLLLTNSFDAPLLTPGQQYFQQLLGYSVARLCPEVQRHRENRRCAPVGLVAMVAVAAIVGVQTSSMPFHLDGHRALIWLTALVAIRVATNRAGWATLVGGIAGLAIALLDSAPTLDVPLAYFLCGVALDVELALVPRLAQSVVAMSFAGASVIFVTLIAPAFPTLGHHPVGAAWTIPPTLAAIAFGALSAMLGHRLGRTLRRGMPLAPLTT